MGSGCGSVGKIYIQNLFTVNCIEKTKIKKKIVQVWPIFKGSHKIGHTKYENQMLLLKQNLESPN